MFDFQQDDTQDAGPVVAQEPGTGFDNAEPAPAVVVVISEAANRPSDEGRERRNHEDGTAERQRLRRARPVYPKKRAPETSNAGRRLGQRSGKARRQRRRAFPIDQEAGAEDAASQPGKTQAAAAVVPTAEITGYEGSLGPARCEIDLANGDCPQNF